MPNDEVMVAQNFCSPGIDDDSALPSNKFNSGMREIETGEENAEARGGAGERQHVGQPALVRQHGGTACCAERQRQVQLLAEDDLLDVFIEER